MLRDFYYNNICELNVWALEHKDCKIVTVFQDYDETVDDYMYHVIYDDGSINRDKVDEFGDNLCYPEKREGSDTESIIVKLYYTDGLGTEKEGYYDYSNKTWYVKEGNGFVEDRLFAEFTWKYLDK